jgi:glycosyltransferase involved in cell wall biosynthesis
MDFASSYFARYNSLPRFFADKPDDNTAIIVIIPCYDEAFVFDTLKSLDEASPANSAVEVIVNVNSGENSPPEVVRANRATYAALQQMAETDAYSRFRLLPLIVESTISKKSGVGYARKTAMDEAVRRFADIDRPEGLIVSLDADTLVDKDYFRTIEHAADDLSAECFTFQFRHDYDAAKYPEQTLHACRLYEMYLRYYRLALKSIGSPFAIHTIGSCFAVRAEAYIRLGGMSPRQGGEDFYFLQKALKRRPVREVSGQIVFPSPRISNRVPFGTGPSVNNIINNKGKYLVYNYGLFGLLQRFYELFPAMAESDVGSLIPEEIMSFVGAESFDAVMTECRRYSSSSTAFVKRMQDHFDAFFIVKFLNTFNTSAVYPPVDIIDATRIILSHYGVPASDNKLYDQLNALDISL